MLVKWPNIVKKPALTICSIQPETANFGEGERLGHCLPAGKRLSCIFFTKIQYLRASQMLTFVNLSNIHIKRIGANNWRIITGSIACMSRYGILNLACYQ